MCNKPTTVAACWRVLIGMTLFLTTTQALATDFTDKDLAVEIQTLAVVAPPPSKFKITAWVDHKNNIYVPGDKLQLYVKSNQDAYVTILNVGTSGKVHIIFPNQHQTDNQVKAGKTVKIPGGDAVFDLTVGGPAGTELIKVLASKSPITVFAGEQTVATGPFKTLTKKPVELAKDLVVTLSPSKPGQWAEYRKVVKIVTNPTP